MTRSNESTSSFHVPTEDAKKAEIIDCPQPSPSGAFHVSADGPSVSGSTRVNLTEVVISGVRLREASPPSEEPPTSS